MMNKKLLNNLLYGALFVSLGTGVVSCKDYDADMEELDYRITTLESDMGRFKAQIEKALNEHETVVSSYPSEDGTQYTIVLSSGTELQVQAAGKSTAFFQFKVDEATKLWKYTQDKGAEWQNVTSDGQTIKAKDKDLLYYDKSENALYIGTTKTDIKIVKDAPIMAEDTENKVLYIHIYGENYTLPIQGGGFSGISTILFQKQYVSDQDDYLEAASLTDTKNNVLAANVAIAKFKILPKDIDLSSATIQCTDIHELKTRADVPTPKLDVKPLEGDTWKLDENGILSVQITPSDTPAEFYGAVLEITLSKAATSSNYFVVKPTSYSLSNRVYAYHKEPSKVYSESDPLKVIGGEDGGLNIPETIGIGFIAKEGEEAKFIDALGFDLDIKAEYEIASGTNVFSVTQDGIVTANKLNESGSVTVTYTISAGEVSDTFSQTFSIRSTFSADDVALTTKETSDIATLSKGTHSIKLANTDKVKINASKAWALGYMDADGKWVALKAPASLNGITKDSKLSEGEICLCYDNTAKEYHLLVGPKFTGMEKAEDLYALNDAKSDKELFTPAQGSTQLGLFVNAKANYVVKTPTPKPELKITIYTKDGINNESPIINYGEHFAIPGEYSDEFGYHFTNVDLRTTLYDFAPADADFKVIIDKGEQNAKVQEKWGSNFKWDDQKCELSLTPIYTLINFNFVDKKTADTSVPASDYGVHISWTFEADDITTKSDGTEQWFIKDPARQPGEHAIYFAGDKQPNATGEISKGYELSISKDITGDSSQKELTDLEVGKVYPLGELLGKLSFWIKGAAWDVYGGPENKTGTDKPVLLKYDPATKLIAPTPYCLKYFCHEIVKRGQENTILKLEAQNNSAKAMSIDSEKQTFMIPADFNYAGVDKNVQFVFVFKTDFTEQRFYFKLNNN